MDQRPDGTEAGRPRGRWLLLAVLALSAAGLGVAAHLTRIHYFTHTDPAYHSMCAVSEKVNCESVAQSAYSVALGLPISVWGLFAYALFAALAILGLARSRPHPAWPIGALFWLALGALAGAAALAFVSFFRIDSMCIFCMALYGVNLALFAVAVALCARARRAPWALAAADLKGALARPLPALILAAALGGGVAAAQLLVPPYWIHLGWRDLPALPQGVDAEGHHWIGAERPTVVITEFSDYQCPHCRRAHRNVRQMAARYPDAVRLVHRHQPLDDACNPALDKPFHRRACELSRAVECAGEQGKFWAMNDAVFSIQDAPGASAEDVDLDRVALQLGLDRPRFRECLAASAAKRRIAADIAEAERRRVQGTPTFFIDAQMYPGGFAPEILDAAVKARGKN